MRSLEVVWAHFYVCTFSTRTTNQSHLTLSVDPRVDGRFSSYPGPKVMPDQHELWSFGILTLHGSCYVGPGVARESAVHKGVNKLVVRQLLLVLLCERKTCKSAQTLARESKLWLPGLFDGMINEFQLLSQIEWSHARHIRGHQTCHRCPHVIKAYLALPSFA